VLYQPVTDDAVNIEPMSPAAWGAMREIVSLILLFIFFT
jgi:hypothetical protein